MFSGIYDPLLLAKLPSLLVLELLAVHASSLQVGPDEG